MLKLFWPSHIGTQIFALYKAIVPSICLLSSLRTIASRPFFIYTTQIFYIIKSLMYITMLRLTGNFAARIFPNWKGYYDYPSCVLTVYQNTFSKI